MRIILGILGYASLVTGSLVSNEMNAVPVQQLDFVYIPGSVVESFLPRRSRREIYTEACEISTLFGLPCSKDVKTQLHLIEAYKKYRLHQVDPDGQKRKQMKTQLCQLNQQLAKIVEERQGILRNRSLMQVNMQGCNEYQICDAKKAECQAIQSQAKQYQDQLVQLNKEEQQLLPQITATKRKLKSFIF